MFPRTKINDPTEIQRTESLKNYNEKKFLSQRQKELFDKPFHLVKSSVDQEQI